MRKRILVWFRNDLRLYDNEILAEAINKADEILPVFIFDPRQFEETPFGTLKTGINRTRFLIESVAELKKSLNGKLVIAFGLPKDILPQLASQYQITEVYHHREVAQHEIQVSSNVEDALWKQKINLRHFIGHTLYNKEDLPFPIKDIPVDFLKFKKRTEREAIVKPCLDFPIPINLVPCNDWGALPSLTDLHPSFELTTDEAITPIIKGGEAEALKKLDEYIETSDGTKKTTKLTSCLIGTQIAAYLSMGCISPRLVYWKLKKAAEGTKLKAPFQQAIQNLLWRDYYRFMLKKHGNIESQLQHARDQFSKLTTTQKKLLTEWKTGKTSDQLVNKIMLQLNNTGSISHPEKLLVARFVSETLELNWVFGACYFEETLIDFCTASNWGNWASIGGDGYDPNQSKSIPTAKIIKLVDPKGEFSSVNFS